MYQFVKESKQYYLDKIFSKICEKKYTVKHAEFSDSTITLLVKSLAKGDDFLEKGVT